MSERSTPPNFYARDMMVLFDGLPSDIREFLRRYPCGIEDLIEIHRALRAIPPPEILRQLHVQVATEDTPL